MSLRCFARRLGQILAIAAFVVSAIPAFAQETGSDQNDDTLSQEQVGLALVCSGTYAALAEVVETPAAPTCGVDLHPAASYRVVADAWHTLLTEGAGLTATTIDPPISQVEASLSSALTTLSRINPAPDHEICTQLALLYVGCADLAEQLGLATALAINYERDEAAASD